MMDPERGGAESCGGMSLQLEAAREAARASMESEGMLHGWLLHLARSTYL